MNFTINNVNVYGLEETIKASGYPMKTEMDAPDDAERARKRLYRLGQAQAGSGHDCALKGITVQMDISAPQYWWPQFQRYHFADIVSSQSKMHRIMEFDIEKQCNSHVKPELVDIVEDLVAKYKKDPSQERLVAVLSNLPMGFYLTARVSTNYLQLKTMYGQRRTHRLPEWQQFCDWVETLPEMKFILSKK